MPWAPLLHAILMISGVWQIQEVSLGAWPLFWLARFWHRIDGGSAVHGSKWGTAVTVCDKARRRRVRCHGNGRWWVLSHFPAAARRSAQCAHVVCVVHICSVVDILALLFHTVTQEKQYATGVSLTELCHDDSTSTSCDVSPRFCHNPVIISSLDPTQDTVIFLHCHALNKLCFGQLCLIAVLGHSAR